MSTEEQLRKLIEIEGCTLFGVIPVGPSTTVPRLREWLDAGMHGTMEWMAESGRVEKRADPEEILPGAQSIVTLAFSYAPPVEASALLAERLDDPSRGIIARYALYQDYHKVLKKSLIRIGRAISAANDDCAWKAYVDTGPVLEREWAQRAGLGFIGRNSMLINFQQGSYLFLAEILVEAPLPEIIRDGKGSCAQCTSCVGGCPTGAIVADGTIDARKCISYLTIEHEGSIPQWIRPLIKNRIYGCDICQEVCPYTQRKAASTTMPQLQLREQLIAPLLSDVLYFDDASFDIAFAGSPIRRATREGFMRNIAVAAGNWAASPAENSNNARKILETIITHESSRLVKEHAQWGIDQSRQKNVYSKEP